MPGISRKFWAWAIVAVVVVGLSYTAVWLTEQMVHNYREHKYVPKRARR